MQEEEFFLVLALFIGGFFLLLPVVRALAERLRGRTALDAAEREELRRFRAEVGEDVQQLRHEVTELGERMDFAERLLAKQHGPAGLKPGV